MRHTQHSLYITAKVILLHRLPITHSHCVPQLHFQRFRTIFPYKRHGGHPIIRSRKFEWHLSTKNNGPQTGRLLSSVTFAFCWLIIQSDASRLSLRLRGCLPASLSIYYADGCWRRRPAVLRPLAISSYRHCGKLTTNLTNRMTGELSDIPTPLMKILQT